MQEKEQKISPIKQRILEFAENLGISKRKFYDTIGVSRGTLESPTGITEDILSKFIAAFPNVNIVWLITGKEVKDANPKDGNLYNQQLLDKMLNQAEEIGHLKARIEDLERRGGGECWKCTQFWICKCRVVRIIKDGEMYML